MPCPASGSSANLGTTCRCACTYRVSSAGMKPLCPNEQLFSVVTRIFASWNQLDG